MEELPYFNFGDWIARPAQCALERKGERVALEPKQMDVLAYLAATGGEVVSTEQLLMDCWRGTFYGDNPVHKTIALLRRALGDNAKEPRYIATVRKRGYRVIAQVAFADERVRGQPPAHTWKEGTPFRGLLPFEQDHAALFFGRSRAVAEVLAMLHAQWEKHCAFILLSGPSGSGKSSLVHAGVLPALMREAGSQGLRALASATLASRSQGLAPCEALAAAMARWDIRGRPVFLDTERRALARALVHDLPDVLERIASAMPKGEDSRGCTLVLVVETLEALAGTTMPWSDRADFLTALDALARCGHVTVFALCRNDFYPSLMEIPELLSLKREGALYDLARPTEGEVAQMIRLPALAAGLRFERDAQTERQLDDILLEAACRRPGALPLLQYTLQALYEMRASGGVLTMAAYAELGGLEGALARRAELAFTHLDPVSGAAFERVLQRLVSLSGDGDEAVACVVPWRALADPAQQHVAQYLVNMHLLVSLLDGEEPCFTVAHEALLRHWPRVVDWIETHRASLRARARIAEMSRRWLAEGCRPEQLLPPGLLLAHARVLYRHASPLLVGEQRLFVRRSMRRARLRQAVLVAMLAAIVVLAAVSLRAAIHARRAETMSEARREDAEELLDFMLGDMHERLDALGRLDLLDAVTGRAMAVLRRDGQVGTPDAVLRRARALREIGEIRFARGNLEPAHEAFASADALVHSLLAQRGMLPSAYAEAGKLDFWRGQVASKRNRREEAHAAWLSYLNDAERRAALEPGVPDAWLELSYANNCLGTFALRNDRLDEAAKRFTQSIALKRQVLAKQPHESKVLLELADTLSWLALVQQKQGALRAVLLTLRDERQAVELAREKGQPTNRWTYRRALTDLHVARAEADLGMATEASRDYASAGASFASLVDEVPDNLNWKRDLAYAQIQQGWLAYGMHDVETATRRLASAETVLQDLLATNGQISDWRHLLALDHNYQSIVWLQRGQSNKAAALLARAWKDLPGEGSATPSASEAMARAVLEVTAGDIAAAQRDRLATTRHGLNAIDDLAAYVRSSRDPHLLDPYVRASLLLGRRGDAGPYLQRLNAMGYRLPMFESYVETHQGQQTP
jgi:DNA-binding winged helix-turn-helix (wHTH) protein